jgi:SAM-dependent methyltransferase
MVFVNPRPTRELLNDFYGSENYVCHSPDAGGDKTAQFLLERVASYTQSLTKRFLDFGCGGGFLLRAALDAGWRASGYDIGKRALASCKAQRLNVTNNLAELEPGQFDVVFLNHVFEHVANPRELLSSLRRLLAKDGKLFIAVPNLAGLRAQLSFCFLSRHFNIDERHRAFPIHLFYYTPRTLVKALEKNGLRVTAVETFGLGLDEFVNRPEVSATGSHAGVDPSRINGRRAFRQMVKKAYFGAHLGENLLVIAQST